MLRFFRTIRRQLLQANKTSKYFRYAIGEILLVVFGILNCASDYFVRKNRRNDYLQEDDEESKRNFYDIIGYERSDDEFMLGLKYQHLVLSNNCALQQQMIRRG